MYHLNKRFCLAVALCLCILAQVCQAQETSPNDDLDDLVVEEIFVTGNEQGSWDDAVIESQPDVENGDPMFMSERKSASLGMSKIDCPPGSSKWECLMMEEDLLAMTGDRNLSGTSGSSPSSTAAENERRRVKRQTNPDDVVDGSGDDGDRFYPNTDEQAAQLNVNNNLTFSTTNDTDEVFDPAAFTSDLQSRLTELLANLPGFARVVVSQAQQDPSNGQVSTAIQIILNSGSSDFATLTNREYLDLLRSGLASVGETVNNNLTVGGRNVISQTPVADQAQEAATILADPCGSMQCPLGFHNCQVVGNSREVQCTHKCFTFDQNRTCEHGAICDLNGEFEPYCGCTKHWTGTYCEIEVPKSELDDGEIAGAALGGAALAIGLIGTCCYLLLCRKRKRNMKFTNYSDEEGSGKFSNPSSKLSNFVIDRPRISIAPISTFNPSAPSESSSGRNPRHGRHTNA